ncbi:Glycerol-3-phosphate dehydrogenase [NAD(+)] [Camellia lanceoleosa]|uniref:Glycerol-3-phosphate dehydrogenase [NAD(+)] n=1 Tax=Camellia lanceoleosa TaxID=1840588 RepID=A0ACC0HYS0_9ERIC|nr:Glycerol-3-phosphate dehydrogenase [NAD(+)] [Camellia lanceoleosa]
MFLEWRWRRVTDRPRDPTKWNEIADVVAALYIPVIENGDVMEYEDIQYIKLATEGKTMIKFEMLANLANLAGNSFTGGIPYSISQMTSLKYLNVGHNQLQGQVNDMFGELLSVSTLEREMKAFSKLLFSSVQDSTFFESCGVADFITTGLGGRNRKCAKAFARNGGKRSFDEPEEEMLQGQKLQGLVVFHWGLGHSLKIDRLGLVGRHWSGMNIAGIEIAI